MLSGESLGKKKLEFENNVNRPILHFFEQKKMPTQVWVNKNGDLQVYEILFCPPMPQPHFIVLAN